MERAIIVVAAVAVIAAASILWPQEGKVVTFVVTPIAVALIYRKKKRD